MHDEDSDGPPPIRRTVGQRVRAVVMLVLVMALAALMMENNGWTDWRGMWRRTMVQFRGGPETLRQKVKVGMTQAEVRQRIGGGEVRFCVRSTDPRDADTPSAAMEQYPDCGFYVVYQGGTSRTSEGWTVTAVEDLP